MTAFDIRDETTGGHQALATRIEKAARQAAPHVEKVTGLPLPTVRICLMDRQAWLDESIRPLVAAVAEAERSGAADRAAMARVQSTALQVELKLFWVLRRGLSVSEQAVDGTCSARYLMVPDAVRHMGLVRAPLGLERMIVHEVVHQAQISTSGGRVVPPQGGGPDPGPFVCGHADWAEAQITHTLWGAAPTDERLRPSLRYRRSVWLRRMQIRLAEALTSAQVERPPRVPRVTEADPAVTHFVGTTIARAGLAPWNHTVWREPNAVPSPEEVQDPQAWMTRMGL